MTSRITLVTEKFHPAVDSSTVTVRHLAIELVALGHEVQIIAAAPGIATYHQSRVTRVRAWEPIGAQVRAALSDFAPDLVLVATPGAIGRKALKHAQRLGLPTVTVEHTAPDQLSVESWLARIPSRSDTVLTVSGWQQERLAAAGVVSSLWLPGVDTDTYTPTAHSPHLHDRWARVNRPGGPFITVGFVGQLRKADGVRRLHELATVPGIRPIIIGDGRQRDWLRGQLPAAKFLPDLNSLECATAIASMDLLVHPGESLTAAHALRAAAACGVPVVAARAGGAAEVVQHLETGLLCDARPGEFADEVAALAADRNRAEFGRHARSLALQRTWRDAATELVDVHLAPLRAHQPAA